MKALVQIRRLWLKITLIVTAIILAGCSATPPTPTPAPTATTAAPTSTAAPDPRPTFTGYTYHQPDGNRLVAGQGSLPDVSPIDIPLGFIPQWVVAAPVDGGSLWVVVMINGQVQAFRLVGDSPEPVPITPERLPAGMPPLLRVENGHPHLIAAPVDNASEATHPVLLPQSGHLAFIEKSGDLIIWNEGEIGRLALNALPDARILVDDADRLLLLTGQTTRYPHGVLGDQIEAGSVTLVETNPSLQVAVTVPIPEPNVVEGIAPIWVDLSGDDVREIIVTTSNESEGARQVVYSEAGEQVAAGPPIGRGYRWRHLLAVAPFGPEGGLELVEVLTPHIFGLVEFHRLSGDTLEMTGQVRDYTSHIIGSGNLDMAAAGDFDGDGRVELLLPFLQTRFELGAIRRSAAGAEVAWQISVGGKMVTNLAAVPLDDGRIAVGVGHDGLKLRIWQ